MHLRAVLVGQKYNPAGGIDYKLMTMTGLFELVRPEV